MEKITVFEANATAALVMPDGIKTLNDLQLALVGGGNATVDFS